MKDTRENILLVSLRLFAQEGYEAVSVSQIAGELGLTKGALYRHYANKQAIFESILQKMEQLDAERAQAFELPEGTVQDMPQSYEIATPEALCAFSKAQFRYWAQDEFAALFRRMLTIEQYRNEQMAALYQQYLAGGPLGYVRDLLAAMGFADAENELALREGMAELLQGKTVLMIAHRLYSIRDADCIYVLDSGRLAESGTHQELLDKNGLYAHLWAIQNETEVWQMKGGVSPA